MWAVFSQIVEALTRIGKNTDASGTTTLFARHKRLDDKVGTNADAAGTTTLFARAKQIYDYLTDTIAVRVGSDADASSPTGSVHAKAKDVKAAIGTSSHTRSNNTVMGWLASPIKSVQRGVSSLSGPGSPLDVAITAVGMNKAFVVVGGTALAGYSYVHVRLTSTTNLRITLSSVQNYGTVEVAWEVIEFY